MVKWQDIVFSLILAPSASGGSGLRGILPIRLGGLYGKIKPLKYYILPVLEKIYELSGLGG
jgi:hypothetical protein